MRTNTWEDDAACAPQNRSKNAKELDWFSTDRDEKYSARAICQSECDVRFECIQGALRRRELHGIWGGVDDYEIRRAMSVDSLGEPRQRDRPPRCPYCLNRELKIATQKLNGGYETKCTKCGLVWQMAVIPASLKQKKKVA